MTEGPTLQDQALEVELHALGLRDLVTRATNRKIKRSDDEIDQMRQRLARADAAARTMYVVAERAAERVSRETGVAT